MALRDQLVAAPLKREANSETTLGFLLLSATNWSRPH